MTADWFLIELAVFVVLLILSGFFSSSETAYTSLTPSQINRIKRIAPELLSTWEKKPDLVLAVLLISNNAVNIAVGVISAGAAIGLSHLFNLRETLVSTGVAILSGVVLLIVGEIIPKIWAKHYPVKWALYVTPILNIWSSLIKPVAYAAVWITNRIVLGPIRKLRFSSGRRESEIKEILTHSVLPTASRRILNNLLEFSETKVTDVMTPRSEIEAISHKEPLNKIVSKVIKTGFSRIPIYASTIDNMVGLIYSKDLLVAQRSGSLILLEDLIRPLYAVSHDMPLSELMREFRSGRHHLAVVKNSESKTMGVITLEDALESIVGEIKEEL